MLLNEVGQTKDTMMQRCMYDCHGMVIEKLWNYASDWIFPDTPMVMVLNYPETHKLTRR